MMKGTKPDPFDEIDAMHERAQRMAREYEDAIRDGNLDMACPYPEIIEIYDKIMKMIVDWDGWGFDSDNNYQVYEASYFNIQQKFIEKYEEDKKLRTQKEMLS
ncbi:hypothetical protein E4H12_04205 [Candidatus Thorarchaeota archaeon]|nr:MAG: hypothetical protein E4H12_04205 [Candidatus Thorarchaeota archaeon]